jgi:diacylglycerol kinase family enzyme
LNPEAGSIVPGDLGAQLQQRMDDWGWKAEFHYVSGKHLEQERVEGAIARGAEIVVAAGGDGTVPRVAAGLLNHSSLLGILPLGTGTAAARALGIPLEPEAAINLLRKRHTLRQVVCMSCVRASNTLPKSRLIA